MKLSVDTQKKYFVLLVVLAILLLYTLQLVVTPITRQWLPKHLKYLNRTSPKKESFVQVFPFTRRNLNRTLKILLWTTWYGDPDWALRDLTSVFSSCAVSDCVLTKNKSEIVKSDALLFFDRNYWTGITGDPLPQYRRQDQVWIWQNPETPPVSPTNPVLYNGVFNWTATYRRDSDVYIPYLWIHKLKKQSPTTANIAASKSLGIAWVASNCADEARRQMLVREIRKYIKVDTYGKCGEKAISGKNMSTVLKQYKFYLAFENSYCRDYVTEKFYVALQRHNIPIVGGGEHYKALAPPHSYIDVTDFDSIKDFVEYLRYLDKNDTAYNEYFDWTKTMEILWFSPWCAFCEALHDGRRPCQVYTDLVGYINDDTCQSWTLTRSLLRELQGYAVKYGFV